MVHAFRSKELRKTKTDLGADILRYEKIPERNEVDV